MGSYANPIVQGEPTSPVLTIPGTIDTFSKPRITPKMRSGYFWVGDRQHYLYARKGSCYLADITWHIFQMADQAIPTTERVWVRGIEITGTDQYFMQGNLLWVNGGAFIHPNERWGTKQVDINLTAYESRDMLVPGDEVKIDYNYYDYSAGTLSAAAGNFVDGVNPGIDVTPNRAGTWADTWTITIPVATGNPAAATVNLATKTVTLTDWVSASTTIQNAIDALNAVGAPFTFAHDGVGSASALLSTSVAAFGGAPISETFAGGVDGGNTSTNLIEIFDAVDGTIQYKFDTKPVAGSPIVMTDDRMYHWDGRDIAPEFIVTEDGFVEFNVPFNYVINPDFEGEPFTPIEWATTGTVTMKHAGNFAGFYPRSGSHYVQLDGAETIAQTLPAFGETEMLLSVAAAGNDVDVTLTFYDSTWTSLGSDTWTIAAGADWDVYNRSYGPSGRERIYDFTIPAIAEHVVIKFNVFSGIGTSYLDYVYWGKTPLEPDHWHPHPMITVEFETDQLDEYYEHHPEISYDPEGNAIANLHPMDPANLGGADNYEVTGFLYWKEDCVLDFRRGLGGTRAITTSVEDGKPLEWKTGATIAGNVTAPDGEGGFFVGGGNNIVYHVNKYGKQDDTLTANANIEALYFDVDAQVLYVGGGFATIGGETRSRLAAYDWHTRTITSWNPGATADVLHIGQGSGDTVVVAVLATGATVGGASRDAFAEIEKSTGVATAWAPASITGGGGRYIVYDDLNDLYIGGGSFTTAGSDFLRMWNGAGVLSAAFDPAADGAVHYIDYDKYTGVAYVAGEFANLYATGRAAFGKVDVIGDALDAWNASVAGGTSQGHSILEVDSQVFLAGNFTTVGGLSRPYLAAVDNSTGTVVSDFRPNPDTLVEGISYSHGVLATAGDFTTIDGVSHAYFSFYPVYTGEEFQGRRHVPYAKINDLGKLAHEGILRYNAQPWVREVTLCSEAPGPGEIRLDDTQFIMIDNGNAFVTDPAAGDTVLDLTATGNDDHVGQEVDRAFAIISDTSNREVIRLKQFDGTVKELLFPLKNSYSSASIDILYPLFKIYTTQDKWLRGKLLDSNGAPLEGYSVECVALAAEYTVSENFDVTNQDGEFKFLVTGVTATPAGPEYIKLKAGTLEKQFSITIETLP